MRTPLSAAGLVLALAFPAACIDPTHDGAVEALGDEVPGVPEGPTHRAGQPCLTCHGGKGPGEPDMSIGGTVFAIRGGAEPAPGVSVILTDATGNQRTVVSNVVGNFYLFKSEWEPVFPLTVGILDDRGVGAEMTTKIMREGSCNACHRGTGDRERMPGVYLRPQ